MARHISKGGIMIKYDNSVCVRINDSLKNTISKICTDAKINEANYVRTRLADCVKHDIENLHELKQEFMYV